MHQAVWDYVAQFATREPVSVLDIGGRDLNGTHRAAFPNADPYVVLDLRPGPNVDIVADASEWEPNRLYDVVTSCECYEHTPKWPGIVDTAYRALKPGGLYVATCAAPGRAPHSGVQATPLLPGEYYANVSVEEMRAAMAAYAWETFDVQQNGLDLQSCGIKFDGGRATNIGGPVV